MSRNTRPRRQIVERYGKPLMVVRPSDPVRSIAIANEAKRTNNVKAFANMLHYCEQQGIQYTFVGYLAQRPGGTPCCVDRNLKVVGELQNGDSFLTEKSVVSFKNPDGTEWAANTSP